LCWSSLMMPKNNAMVTINESQISRLFVFAHL
jgi:hypothetical protein